MNFNIDAEIEGQSARIVRQQAEGVQIVNGVLSIDGLRIEAQGISLDDLKELGNEVVVILRLRPKP